MSDKIKLGGDGTYEGFEAILETLKNVSKRLPKGVRLKRERDRYLNFQITLPSGKRKVKPSGCEFTDLGIYQALDKAWKIRNALDTFQTESHLWEWYDKEILGNNNIVDDLITYREIFEKIEQSYWDSRNRNTRRTRGKSIPNDVVTLNNYYGLVFKKFSNWDKQPEWDEIKSVLFSWEQGTKLFKDAYSVIKRICRLCPNPDKFLGLLAEIDGRQTIFKERQSISLKQLLDWHQQTLDNAQGSIYLETRQSWLWVCSMCVVYGLRPTEIAAIANLTKPYSQDGITIPALNDRSNKSLLIVLLDKTYFGTTIKTGGRICRPLVNDKALIERLQIQVPRMPEYTPRSNNPKTITNGFSKNMRDRLKYWNCPVTQMYAFRHLGNQLGEQYGIPQEIRARSLGHSTTINDSIYKQRTNFQTSIDILTEHAKQPLDYGMATNRLEALGFDLSIPSARAIFRVIYQLDD